MVLAVPGLLAMLLWLPANLPVGAHGKLRAQSAAFGNTAILPMMLITVLNFGGSFAAFTGSVATTEPARYEGVLLLLLWSRRKSRRPVRRPVRRTGPGLKCLPWLYLVPALCVTGWLPRNLEVFAMPCHMTRSQDLGLLAA